MKRAVILFAVLCILAGGASAQQIRTSPFEGRWIWDGKGEDYPDFTELVFFGNVMLGTDEDYPVYEGETFTYTGRTINFGNDYYEWEYRLSGNVLAITDEYDEHFSYTKATIEKSPIEGIWKQTGGADYDPDYDYYCLFTGNIMAEGDEYGYDGVKIEFSGKIFHPSRVYLGEDISEKQLMETAIEYRISGRSLTLISPDGEDEITLTKIY